MQNFKLVLELLNSSLYDISIVSENGECLSEKESSVIDAEGKQLSGYVIGIDGDKIYVSANQNYEYTLNRNIRSLNDLLFSTLSKQTACKGFSRINSVARHLIINDEPQECDYDEFVNVDSLEFNGKFTDTPYSLHRRVKELTISDFPSNYRYPSVIFESLSKLSFFNTVVTSGFLPKEFYNVNSLSIIRCRFMHLPYFKQLKTLTIREGFVPIPIDVRRRLIQLHVIDGWNCDFTSFNSLKLLKLTSFEPDSLPKCIKDTLEELYINKSYVYNTAFLEGFIRLKRLTLRNHTTTYIPQSVKDTLEYLSIDKFNVDMEEYPNLVELQVRTNISWINGARFVKVIRK